MFRRGREREVNERLFGDFATFVLVDGAEGSFEEGDETCFEGGFVVIAVTVSSEVRGKDG